MWIFLLPKYETILVKITNINNFIDTRFGLYFGPHLHSVATMKANPFCKHSYPLASMMPCPSGFFSALVTATSSSSFFFFLAHPLLCQLLVPQSSVIGSPVNFLVHVCLLSRFSYVWIWCYSPPGSSVHGESPSNNSGMDSMPSFRGSSWPRDQTLISCVSCIGRRVL